MFRAKFEVEEVREKEKRAGGFGRRSTWSMQPSDRERESWDGRHEGGRCEGTSFEVCSFRNSYWQRKKSREGSRFRVSLSVLRRKERLRTTLVSIPRT